MSGRLSREEGEKDDRVDDFRPDPWQRTLLDYVDRNESVVEVAPTSAGKTFIQYYAMKKVLQKDNTSVLAYVCPTKALCNQVVSGVVARFSKNFNSQNCSIVGLFTRDERRDEHRCQILVTVPQCLDILLLSPTREAQDWAKRVSWIIFDEVHSLNDPSQGACWERILQFTQCPFLALSATVGEPEKFQNWLQSSRPCSKVHLIVHKERFNDLRTFVTGTAGKLLPLHPLTITSWQQLRLYGYPSMADFEARDALELFNFMYDVKKDAVKDLSPTKDCIRENMRFISRRKCKEWSARLVDRLVEWSRNDDPSPAIKVLEKFNSMLKEEDVAPFDEDFNLLFKVTSDLLVDGPVLLFCMYRQTCEECVSNFAERLEAQEKEDAFIKLALSEKKEKARANAKAKSDKKLAKMGDKQREEYERLPQEDTMETAPDPTAFTLRRLKSSMGKDKREAIIEKMMHKLRWDVSHPLVRGLRRGVGCHHGGLPHKYRVAVELLFRTGDLGAVFATTTLAMGIHAPARSVVILKDMTFLNGTSLRKWLAERDGAVLTILAIACFWEFRTTESNRCSTVWCPP